MTDIEKLLAIQHIAAVKARYFRFVDTKNWSGLHGLFTEDATLHYPEGEAEPLGLDAAMAMIAQSLAGATSVHHGHMPEIEIRSADTAHAVFAMEDTLSWSDGRNGLPGRYYHGYGHYHEEYRLVGDRWLIRRLKLTRLRLDRFPAAVMVS